MNFPDIDLKALAVLEAIRRTGSPSRAAAELQLAPPTLFIYESDLKTPCGPLWV